VYKILTGLPLFSAMSVHVFSQQITIVVLNIIESKSHTNDTVSKSNYAMQLLNHSITSR